MAGGTQLAGGDVGVLDLVAGRAADQQATDVLRAVGVLGQRLAIDVQRVGGRAGDDIEGGESLSGVRSCELQGPAVVGDFDIHGVARQVGRGVEEGLTGVSGDRGGGCAGVDARRPTGATDRGPATKDAARIGEVIGICSGDAGGGEVHGCARTAADGFHGQCRGAGSDIDCGGPVIVDVGRGNRLGADW